MAKPTSTTDANRQQTLPEPIFPWHRIVPVLLILVTVAVYFSSLDGKFIFDDEPQILKDQAIHDFSWQVFTASRPLVRMTLAMNYAWTGSDPRSYKIVNLLVHLLAGITLYGLVRRTLLLPKIPEKFHERSTTLAAIAALLWMIHPLTTAAVTYTIQRAESMMGMFYLLALYAYLRSAISTSNISRWGWGIALVLATALGMLSKEVMVTLPAIVLLYDICFLSGRDWKAMLKSRWPLLLAVTAVTLLVLKSQHMEMLLSSGKADEPVGTVGMGLAVYISPWQYALTQCKVILYYIFLILWPLKLVLDYSWPPIQHLNDIGGYVALFSLFVLASIALLFTRPKLGFLLAWFLIILSPTSSFIPVLDVIFEHRVYLPMAGIIVFIVLMVAMLFDLIAVKSPAFSEKKSLITICLLLIVATLLGARTFARNLDYCNPIDVWEANIRDCPLNPRAYHNVGALLNEAGKKELAMERYEQALALTPKFLDARVNIANIRLEMGLINQGIAHLKIAKEDYPNDANVRYNLGRAFLMAGQNDAGEKELHKAVELKPTEATYHNNLAIASARLGKTSDAIEHFSDAIRLSPKTADYHNNLANALATIGQYSRAVAAAKQACALEPSNARYQIKLGKILLLIGDVPAASNAINLGLSLDANLIEGYVELAWCKAMQNHAVDAANLLTRAITADTGSVEAKRRLAWLMATSNSADPILNNPTVAIGLAKSVNLLTKNSQASALDTLAAALAQAQQFDEALSTIQKAITIAQTLDMQQATQAMQARAELYKNHQSYHPERFDPGF